MVNGACAAAVTGHKRSEGCPHYQAVRSLPMHEPRMDVLSNTFMAYHLFFIPSLLIVYT
ncbi:UNVERIFIED_CONTAM: hypothetical protein FKN15_031651 [Acipenser sinensis]